MQLKGKAIVPWDGAEAMCSECGIGVILEMKDRPVDVSDKGMGGASKKHYTFECPVCGQPQIVLKPKT